MGMKNKGLKVVRLQLGELIEHICYIFMAVVQSQTETNRTLTSEESRPACRIAAP